MGLCPSDLLPWVDGKAQSAQYNIRGCGAPQNSGLLVPYCVMLASFLYSTKALYVPEYRLDCATAAIQSARTHTHTHTHTHTRWPGWAGFGFDTDLSAYLHSSVAVADSHAKWWSVVRESKTAARQ